MTTLFKPEVNAEIGTQEFVLKDVCNATGQRSDSATRSINCEFGKDLMGAVSSLSITI